MRVPLTTGLPARILGSAMIRLIRCLFFGHTQVIVSHQRGLVNSRSARWVLRGPLRKKEFDATSLHGELGLSVASSSQLHLMMSRVAGFGKWPRMPLESLEEPGEPGPLELLPIPVLVKGDEAEPQETSAGCSGSLDARWLLHRLKCGSHGLANASGMTAGQSAAAP
jgi:hypothetical protein